MKPPVSHTILIVGGGFGGLNAAKSLANQPGLSVLLVDQRNHHLFQPLLYQVATAGLNPGDIAAPIRAQFSKDENIEVHWGEVQHIDLTRGIARVASAAALSELRFDSLILACGARHSYFSHPEWEDFAPGLKTLEQATEIRRRILSAFENAENESDPVKQTAYLTFIVVGAGPTGVELAGAIADISRTVLVRDFRRIDPSKARVILVEAGPRVLAAFDERLSHRTEADLKQLGVELRKSALVENIDASGVRIGLELIPASCVFWAAGVQAASLEIVPAPEVDRSGRIKVCRDLTIPTFSNAFVVGDMASIETSPGKFIPGLAPAANQAGRHAAAQILATREGRPRQDFRYQDKGQMATIGKFHAVLQSGSLRLSGRLAWFAWLFVHVFYLIGFKNRFAVMAQWAWSYLFSKRGTRLITEREWKLKE